MYRLLEVDQRDSEEEISVTKDVYDVILRFHLDLIRFFGLIHEVADIIVKFFTYSRGIRLVTSSSGSRMSS